jgi:hypothetical protein
MTNRELYVKYMDNEPVLVETQYIGEETRKRPLDTISNLLAAYFPSSPPNELAGYTFHLKGNGHSISGDTLLSSLETDVGLLDSPLILLKRTSPQSAPGTAGRT